jgi:hypothetical protein
MANNIIGMPLQFSRMYAAPIDDTDLHESLEAAAIYANSTLAYPGQMIKVLVNGEYIPYIINPDKTLKPMYIASAPEWEALALPILTDLTVKAGKATLLSSTSTIPFNSDVKTYDISSPATSTISITPVSNAGISITINTESVESGIVKGASVTPGELNIITIVVTENGVSETYTLNITVSL